MTDSSSSKHPQQHKYAVPGEHFPGALGHGGTAQTIRQPEVLAEAEVGKPVVKRSDRKAQKRS